MPICIKLDLTQFLSRDNSLERPSIKLNKQLHLYATKKAHHSVFYLGHEDYNNLKMLPFEIGSPRFAGFLCSCRRLKV